MDDKMTDRFRNQTCAYTRKQFKQMDTHVTGQYTRRDALGRVPVSPVSPA